MNEIYKRMKAKGLDMTWYEKSKRYKQTKEEIPLTDDHCGLLSIYFLNKSGRLFTTQSDGEKYMQVKQLKPRDKDGYLCLHCKKGWDSYAKATAHINGA